MSAGITILTSRTLLVALCVTALTLAPAHAGPPSVLTQHNDNARTGANLQETILTPGNVNVATFGKLFTRTLDANVNGQVLYVPGLTIQGGLHNVIFAYTSDDKNQSPCSVYAFDADDPSMSAPLWRHVFSPSAIDTLPTPVIDPATHAMYVLRKENDNHGLTRLHALDLTTGLDLPGSPATIQGSVAGNADGSVKGVVSFDTTKADCKPGLLLLNGVVYCAFADNLETPTWHGWVFGYRYDGAKFTQTIAFCTTPNGQGAGIWQAGNGLAADDAGNIYCTTGNGTFDADSGGGDYGMCVLKLSTPDLEVTDWFAPFDEQQNSDADADLGSSGPMLIPETNRLFDGSNKAGSAFLLDSQKLGHFQPGGPDHVLARFDYPQGRGIGQNPVCWDTGAVEYVYVTPGDSLLQYKYDSGVGLFDPAGAYRQSSRLDNVASLAITANGNHGGILWAQGQDKVFYAFDATDVSRPPLWSSAMNPARDGLGSAGHFQFPTVVNGKAYVPNGAAGIVAYGLLPPIAGDVNGDGRVTVGDATLALRMALGLLTPTPAQAAAADLDGDGGVDTMDALLILRKALGL